MNRITKVKYWLTITLASLFVALSYELRKNNITIPGLPHFLTALIAFSVGTGTATLIVNTLLKKWQIRRWLMGKLWIEGYWLKSSETDTKIDSPVALPGILYLEYLAGTGSLKAVVTRYSDKGVISIGNSDVAYLREDENRIQYLNYFSISYEDINGRNGMAISEFSRNNAISNHPNILSGRIVLEGDGLVRRQTGLKINRERVVQLEHEFGEHTWMKKLLESNDPVEIIENNP